NEEMRAVIENIQLHTLEYAEDTSLSGQAVKASQTYFQATYTTVTESLLEVLDTSEELLNRYLNDFSNQVDPSPSCQIDSDILQMAADKVDQIKRKQEDLQRSLSSATAGLYEGKAQQLRMDLAEAVEQEKILERYQEFEHGHNDFFQELCDLMYKTRQVLQHVLTNVTFNEQQGSYSFPVGYASAIADLQKELNEIRDIDAKKEKELEDYEIYAVVYTGENGKPEVMWILEQNGHAVRNYELTDYLKKTGQYLSKDRYQVLSLDGIEDKVLEGWKEGGYYLNGKKYSGVAGATLKASAYVQGGAEWVQESDFANAVLGLGLSVAAIRGSTTYKNESGIKKIYNANGNPDLRALRRKQFDEVLKNGFPDGTKLNQHAYNSLFKSGRKDIMLDDIIDALKTKPIPAKSGSVEYVNPITGTSVFVNPVKKEVVGIWPASFKK
ncbi:T7SS effector LXG polymorphic toxin, partial [Listeria costaricensis]|uniref:T7SS effector LXG polymorphic toxin n=1 Tax=Listeria costaricensis TaxID=2026604 RepID=UPI0013C4DBDB